MTTRRDTKNHSDTSTDAAPPSTSSKERKKYKNYKEDKKPALTEEQVKLLDEIDFFEPAEVRLSKYVAMREKKKDIKAKSVVRTGKRGRPKSKTLIPQEAQEMMSPQRNVGLTHMSMYTNTILPTAASYPVVEANINEQQHVMDVDNFDNSTAEKNGTGDGSDSKPPLIDDGSPAKHDTQIEL